MNKTYLSRYLHSLLSSSYADEKSEVSSLLERQYKVRVAISSRIKNHPVYHIIY